VLYARASTDPADAPLQDLLAGDLADDDRLSAALSQLRVSSAMERARADLRRWADDARSVLTPLPDAPAKAALASLCDLVVDRTA
jgi:heptaprenyl diphosphate synthase